MLKNLLDPKVLLMNGYGGMQCANVIDKIFKSGCNNLKVIRKVDVLKLVDDFPHTTEDELKMEEASKTT